MFSILRARSDFWGLPAEIGCKGCIEIFQFMEPKVSAQKIYSEELESNYMSSLQKERFVKAKLSYKLC